MCRTFNNYFGQFVCIEKKSHYNNRVSLHKVPTKNGEKSGDLAEFGKNATQITIFLGKVPAKSYD